MIIESLTKALHQYNLEIGTNTYEDIFALYDSDEYFARVSNNFPVKMETIIEDVDTIPPFTTAEKKHYISIYNDEKELVAVIDFIEGYSYKNMHGENAIWIGLLQIDKRKQHLGLGKSIINALFESCKENHKEFIQIGVIKENERALKFWTKQGFDSFTEVNNGDFDLVLMEKHLDGDFISKSIYNCK